MERDIRIEALEELNVAAQPLVDYLYRYGNPHSCVIVTQTDAEMLNGERRTMYEQRD